ncbi:GNAT family N-acetyltransferase [Halomarina oriensis]|uniref:GNAT family N-acetyltransferase n=1 Tax=Halomarina oriensis TaxID=671145 RepID=A0A6B0GV75_9EURY|nr:GNAT family N-acetyltransferase [Halomarina oriensis]MWG35638.1 GNAT family N-acetyltransferase [Halomarina oriensis]
MYLRDAKNREEVWLLDHIEAMGLDGQSFRSRDYVVAVDEESNVKAGFGRFRIHTPDDEDATETCELTSIGVLDGWRGQGVGAHVVERLVTTATNQGFEDVYALTDRPNYLSQFGFRAVEREHLPEVLRERLDEKRETTTPEAIGMHLDTERFRMPERLRERFKVAAEQHDPEPDPDAEEFGIDPDEATYKYDTGR